MKSILCITITCFLFAAGCSSSSTSSSDGADSNEMDSDELDNNGENSSPNSALTGVFIDSPVSGISYATETLSGSTNGDGEFNYIDGESVTFSIGELVFPSISASETVTPVDMSADGDISDNIVINTATLLQSLDEDANLLNGIQIPAGAVSMAAPIDLTVEPTAFAQDATVINLVANSGSQNSALIGTDDAMTHLSRSIENIGFVQLTNETISSIFDKQLFLFDGETQTENFIVLRDGGTLDGTWDGAPIAGTWEMRDDYWCRVLTEFINPDRTGSEDCQLWQINESRINGTRDRGAGSFFRYNIVE